MKRAQIEALMVAHRQRAHAVASLHVLCQPALEQDDHAFLQAHIDALGGADLLRWLSRCQSQGLSKAPVLRALASLAMSDPQQFRFEIIGSGERFLDEHDWAELAELLWGKVPADIARAVLCRTSGCDIYRALLRPAMWEPDGPLDLASFGAEPAEVESLARMVSEAFEDAPGQPPLRLARELFAIRYDERACRLRLQGPAPIAVGAAHMLWEIERAGLMSLVGWPFALLPQVTRFLCELVPADRGGREALREAYVRHVALTLPGEAVTLGRAWYVAQLAAAVERGVSWPQVLREVPASVRDSLRDGAPELRARIEREAGSLPVAVALSVRQLLPWAIDEESLAAMALVEARHAQPDWAPSIAGFPQALREAVIARVKHSPRGAERASLLDWLKQHGVGRKTLVEMAVDSLVSSEVSLAIVAWLARQLATRTAWEQHGPRTVGVLIERGCYAELGDLLTLSWSEAREEGEADGERQVPSGFREALHWAFSLALIALTKRALEERCLEQAAAALSALACLDPPSRLSRSLHELGRRADLSDDVRELLSINAGMVRHGAAREASLQGAIAAVHVLADTLGDGLGSVRSP